MFTFLQSNLFHVGVSNAVLATGLALLVFLITWRSKWPAWSHALWVLVLVKLVAPPIYWVGAELPASASSITTAATPGTASDGVLLGEGPSAIQINTLVANTKVANTIPTTGLQVDDTAAANRFSWLSRSSIVWLSIAWLVGAVGVFGVTIYRCAKFKRWLGRAESAPSELVDLVHSVADQVGLGRVPKVLLVRGVIAPSVYSLGRGATLLLPVGLVDQLTDSELKSVVAHELTHLRRGDHWVRLLEIVAGALFWWHPIVPLARRKIHQAADESCDAGVMSQIPNAARDYASAMLKTVDFLSGVRANRNAERAAMPLMIAIGDSRSLMRRIRQISQSAASPSVSLRGRLFLAAAALLLLPVGMLTLAPTSIAGQPPAQESPAKNDKPAGKRNPFETGNQPLDDPSGGRGNRSSRGVDPFGSGRRVDPFASENMPTAKATKAPVPGDETQELNAERKQAVEDRLRAALRTETSLRFPDTPLNEALRVLSEAMNVPIIIDRVALEGLGLTSDTPITISLEDVSMRSMLQLMLRDLELTYMIKDEVILITTVEFAEKNPTLKTYILPAELSDRSEKILEALTSNVKPDIWKDEGGSSTASAIDNVLVVSTTETVHDEVETFLRKIEAAFKVFQQKPKPKPKPAAPGK